MLVSEKSKEKQAVTGFILHTGAKLQRKRSSCIAKEPEKVRTGFYIEKEVLDRCDELLSQANVKSRNEFVTEALKFYCGYLTSQKIENYLLQSLSSVLISTIRDTENRLARMDFKIATELSKLSHVVAHTHAVDEQAMESLHLKCVEEVKRINGAVDFEDAYRYQKRRV